MPLVSRHSAFFCWYVVVTAHRGRTDEPPFEEHGTGGSLHPEDKVSIAVPPSQCNVKIGQVHVVRLQDEVTIICQDLNSKGSHQVGHVRHMISEVIRESDGLEDCLLNCGLRKVKDLQALLWSE